MRGTFRGISCVDSGGVVGYGKGGVEFIIATYFVYFTKKKRSLERCVATGSILESKILEDTLAIDKFLGAEASRGEHGQATVI